MVRKRRFHPPAWPLALVAGLALTVLGATSCASRAPVSPGPRDQREPRLLYLGRSTPDTDLRQLFVAPLDGSPVRQLTDRPLGVWDYAVHPQGEGIVYSALREDGGSDLWRMERDGSAQRLLLACPAAACMNPAWSPDGLQLAYERRGLAHDGPDLDPEASRIWLLDWKTAKTQPLFDYDVPLHSPVWSPTPPEEGSGERLAYLSPLLPGVEVYDLRSGELWQFGNEWGAAPTWSPDGSSLVMPEMVFAGEALAVRLFRVDLRAEEALDISGEDLVKDASPAWSPDGEWLAFGRQFLEQERWTPGRQIWLTRPDGSEARELVHEAAADHFAFAWRPDGGALAYLRDDLSKGPQPAPDISLWIFDLASSKSLFVADDAVQPRWLP